MERITYHNEQNGWSVIKVSKFRDPGPPIAVLIHQAKVFAGATMEFEGYWSHHAKYGQQFKAVRALEKKPASAAALEKYLGSGMIRGVGPVIAHRIVSHFKEQTLKIFEEQITDLLFVPGISHKKLEDIKKSWIEHKSIRDVMIFLQTYGVSSLFAVKIYRQYGDQAIQIVTENPYALARDIYGIGFFSADQIANQLGFQKDGLPRIEAGIKHVLSASRDFGHCYLTEDQIQSQVETLLEIQEPQKVSVILQELKLKNEIKSRFLNRLDVSCDSIVSCECFYSKSIYFDEAYVAKKIAILAQKKIKIDPNKVHDWIDRYCSHFKISLSDEQQKSIEGLVSCGFSILTGGPGCGKTTSTKVLVKLLQAMSFKIILTAPTGRAAQRMKEVIGEESQTIHRLLEWAPDQNNFKKNESQPLNTDFLIVDECSMLDINLASSLLKAVSNKTQVLFIGDADQLPSVGAGNVLSDLLQSEKVPKFYLTKIFRQAESSSIIQFAHKINRGEIPKIKSPISEPHLLTAVNGKWPIDCLFFDSDEATLEQIKFIQRAKSVVQGAQLGQDQFLQVGETISGVLSQKDGHVFLDNFYCPEFDPSELQRGQTLRIPDKFLHVDLIKLASLTKEVDQIKALLSKVHPWSTLHHGLTASDTILRLYSKTIPEILGPSCEIQVLSPQVRGTLGTQALNLKIQESVNPQKNGKKQLIIGDRIFREKDRVIQTRNNYDLGVFNGDIGVIDSVDLVNFKLTVFYSSQDTYIQYEQQDIVDLNLAYAITIHKSQGSEFEIVIIPVVSQHFKMLFRNLIYTGLTRAKKLALFVGSRKALIQGIRSIDQRKRQTALQDLLVETTSLYC